MLRPRQVPNSFTSFDGQSHFVQFPGPSKLNCLRCQTFASEIERKKVSISASSAARVLMVRDYNLSRASSLAIGGTTSLMASLNGPHE